MAYYDIKQGVQKLLLDASGMFRSVLKRFRGNEAQEDLSEDDPAAGCEVLQRAATTAAPTGRRRGPGNAEQGLSNGEADAVQRGEPSQVIAAPQPASRTTTAGGRQSRKATVAQVKNSNENKQTAPSTSFKKDKCETKNMSYVSKQAGTARKKRKNEVLDFKDEVANKTDSSDEESPYAVMREKALQERQKLLRDFGLLEAKQEFKETVALIRKRKHENAKKVDLKSRTIPACSMSLRQKGNTPSTETIIAEEMETGAPEINLPKRAVYMKKEDCDGSEPETFCSDKFLKMKPHFSSRKQKTTSKTDGIVRTCSMSLLQRSSTSSTETIMAETMETGTPEISPKKQAVSMKKEESGDSEPENFYSNNLLNMKPHFSSRKQKTSLESVVRACSKSLKQKKDYFSTENLNAEEVETEIPEISPKEPSVSVKKEKSDGSEPSSFCSSYFLEMKTHVSNRKQTTMLEKDSLVSFQTEVQKLKLRRIRQIVKNGVSSASVHPSESKLLVAAGDKCGNLGLWDVESSEESLLIELQLQCIRRVSFSLFNPQEIISSSCDGTVYYGDIMKETFYQVYTSSDYLEQCYPTCWHAEVNPYVLLIAHSSGEVVLFDLRVPKVSASYKCHQRSMRTVDPHPFDENFFVTTSCGGEARIWDIRSIHSSEPLLLFDLKHKDTVSSAFFSPDGNHILTTCFDDRLRVYDVKNLGTEIPRRVMNIKHKNRTSKSLAPIRAKWHPQREDLFVVGSTEKPRRVQLYGINGKILHELFTPNLDFILPVCEFHPTKLILAAGNSSGNICVFQ